MRDADESSSGEVTTTTGGTTRLSEEETGASAPSETSGRVGGGSEGADSEREDSVDAGMKVSSFVLCSEEGEVFGGDGEEDERRGRNFWEEGPVTGWAPVTRLVVDGCR